MSQFVKPREKSWLLTILEVAKKTSQDQLVDVLTSEAEHVTLDSPVPRFMEGSVGVVKDIGQEQTDEETLSVQQLEIMEQLSAAAEAREAAREEVAKQTLAAEAAHVGVLALRKFFLRTCLLEPSSRRRRRRRRCAERNRQSLPRRKSGARSAGCSARG